MSRLHEIQYNENQWHITSSRNSGYHIVNQNNHSSFSLGGDIIGIEQILDDTFLVFRRILRDRWQISRIRVINGVLIIEYRKDFEHFYFITHDTILFDSSAAYSIEKNCELSEFDWLKYKKIDVLVSDTDEEKTVLFVEHQISYEIHAGEYVQVLVDSTTFMPISKAYSTLRDQFIDLSDTFTFDDLVKEDTRYANRINDYLFDIHQHFHRKGKTILLKEAKDFK